MARIGPIIQETRLKKGINLDRVADETNISVRFLKKIEADDFTGFPGEPYVVGFIRNYADYLGLDPEPIIARYRADETLLAESAAGEALAHTREVTTEEQPAEGNLLSAEKRTESLQPAGQIQKTKETLTIKKSRTRKTAAAKSENALSDTTSQTNGTVKSGGFESNSTIQTTVVTPDNAAPGAPDAGLKAGQNGVVKDAPAGIMRGEAGKAPYTIPQSEPGKAPGARLKSGPQTRISSGVPKSLQNRKKPGLGILIGVIILSFLAAGAAFLLRNRGTTIAAPEKAPQEYRVEGSSFEKRIYPGDSLLIQTGSDVISVKLQAINDAAVFETPQGVKQASLGGNITFDLNADTYPEAILSANDFEKGKPRNGVLVKVELPISQTAATSNEITVPAGTPEPAKDQPPANSIIFKSPRGPYSFMATLSFRGNCMLRYEADRKEWVEKYYQKGESVSVNVSSSLIIWASNAQAAKLTIQATGGKTYDHELGLPGEIVVKKISWAQQDGSWALVASNYE